MLATSCHRQLPCISLVSSLFPASIIFPIAVSNAEDHPDCLRIEVGGRIHNAIFIEFAGACTAWALHFFLAFELLDKK